VLVVGDGLDHLTPSMKMQLKRMFGNRCPVEKTDWPDDGANICVINTYSTPVDGSSSASDESGNGSGTVAIRRLSLVLKRRNLRKMNSHEWLFRAFAIGSTYAFTTDCATLLHPDCLATFCRHFEQHPTCVAATGRKLTQTAAQQADKHDTEAAKDSWSESVLRQTQAYMFETEGNSVLAATDAFWVLNPLHGPCSFFHYPRMASGRLLEHYFNIAYSKSSETGLLMGNVRLGEDALLAALSLFQVVAHAHTNTPKRVSA
jgi:cellulose synthase/poly-beta-1,6-N-acetylglucosamine synthase-like glycosyltransferase